MILISGATGGIGGEICRLLAGTGTPFRAMVRQRHRPRHSARTGPTRCAGRFDRPTPCPPRCRASTRCFIHPAHPAPVRAGDGRPSTARARRASAASSSCRPSDANVRSTVPWARTHARIDHICARRGSNGTILKPTAFMQNFLWFKDAIAKGFLRRSRARVRCRGSTRATWPASPPRCWARKAMPARPIS